MLAVDEAVSRKSSLEIFVGVVVSVQPVARLTCDLDLPMPRLSSATVQSLAPQAALSETRV